MKRTIILMGIPASLLSYVLSHCYNLVSAKRLRTAKYSVIFLLLSFFTSKAQETNITIGSSSFAGMGSGMTASSLTWSHTIGSNNNGILIVSIAIRTNISVSTVTFGGTNLLLIGSQVESTDKIRSEMWYLKAPAPGTYNIIVTLAGSANFAACATNFYGINQAIPYGIVVNGQGTGDPSLDVASASGELVIDGVADRDVDTESVGFGQTILWTNKNGTGSNDAWVGTSMKAGGATVNMSWTTTGGGAGEWAGVAISLKPAMNNAPTLDNSGTMKLITISEDQTSTTGNTIAEIIASAGGDRITDPDPDALEGLAITSLASGNGTWQFSINGGASWSAVGSVSEPLALLLRNIDLLRFIPDAKNADFASITFRAWDQTTGTAGTKVDVTINGGTTAFSTFTESASITVNAVNDAPSLSVGVALPAINEDDSNNNGFLVSSIAGYAVDIDDGAVKGLALPGLDNSNGSWQYTLDGKTWQAIGNVTTSSARLLPSNTTARIRFVPNPNWYGTTGMFYYLAWDQTSGSAGGLADVTVRGGTTAFSSGISGSVQTVNSVNDTPVITSNNGGATASININENTLAVTTVTATDIDVPAQTLTFSKSGGEDAARFTVNSSTGVLTFISAPDFENPTDADLNNIYILTVQVSDGTLTDTQTISVTIANLSNQLVVTTSSDISDGNVTSIEALNANKGADGFISLREAILAANNTLGTDTVNFNIAGTGVHTITPATALPAISGSVIIDATTDDSFAANGNRPAIILDGNNIVADGLVLSNNADGSIIRGFVIRDFGRDGIEIQAGSNNNNIAGNYVGRFTASGANAGLTESNAGYGVNVLGSGNLIGGLNATERNLIGGNGIDGIAILGAGATENVIQGNYIGTDRTGTTPIANTEDGIWIDGATNNIIGGIQPGAGNLVSGNSWSGIALTNGANSNFIQGNYIGTNAIGTAAMGNGIYGINITTSNNTVGGNTAAERNVISGNIDNGIYIGDCTNNVISGNYIGTTFAGNVALGNQSEGIEINGATNTRIGGTTPGAGNVIAASGQEGIWIINGSTGTLIQGNWIGTDVTGTVNLGNVHGGIRIGNTGTPSNGNLIGGTGLNEGNVIAFNTQAGVAVDRTSSGPSLNNPILGNSIYSNSGIGIDLDDLYSSPASDGVTPNDIGDADIGGNNRQNFPVVSGATSGGGKTVFTVSLNSTASTKFRIEFFTAPAGDPTGYGEGKTFLGFTTVTTDPGGNARINVILNGVSLPIGYVIMATATVDLGNGNYGNTSEFSANASISAATNDNPCNAAELQVNQTCSFTTFSNLDATDSGIPITECNGYSGGDIWFKVQVPTSGNVIIKIESDATDHFPNNNGWAHRLGLAVYNGICSNLVYDTCYIESEGQGIPVNPEMILKEYTPGATLYLRVWEYNNDDNGQFRICAFTDIVNPTINCPGNINGQTNPGSCIGSVTVPLPVTEDNYGIRSVINDYNGTNEATDDYPVGTTIVTWTVTDLAGNSASCIQTITIADNQNPEINCLQNRTEYLNNDCGLILPDYTGLVTVNDNCDPSPSLSQSPAAGTILSGEGTIQEVTIFSTDKYGNTGSCTFNILLHDNTPPLLSCSRDTIITLDEGIYKTEVTISAPMASDNCGIRSVINDFNGGTNATGTYGVGTTVVNYTVTDVNGNSTQCSQQITIKTNEEFPFGLVIPQGFSPNDDGLNDRFEILGIEAYPENELIVYNVWGYEVYYMSGYDNSWDGIASKGLSSGKKLPTGTYYYILRLGNEQLIKGFVYLLKNN